MTQVLRKAYKVKDPTVWSNDGRHCLPEDNWEIVYAESQAQAKTKCSDFSEFINIQALRAPFADEVDFEGSVTSKAKMEHTLAQRAKKAARVDAVMRFPADTLFYVQNGYSGNCVCWWGMNNSGYVIDIEKAQKYTREYVLQHFTGARDEDRVWPAHEVEQKTIKVVDSQYLDGDFVS